MSKASSLASVSGSANFSVSENYIVNPGFRIHQLGTASSTTDGFYIADQWPVGISTSGVVTASRNNTRTPGGSNFRGRVTVTTADTTLASNEFVCIWQMIEGARLTALKWGTGGAAKNVTLRFGVRASVAGTYSVGLRNKAATRSYVTTYTISPSEVNTDVVKIINIPGDQSGSYDESANGMLAILWAFASGSAQATSVLNTWQNSNAFAATGMTNGLATVNATFDIFDVGLYLGDVAPPFVLPPYDQDLALCQRYYEIGMWQILGTATAVNQTFAQWCGFSTQKRAAPSVTSDYIFATNVNNTVIQAQSISGFRVYVQSAAAGTIESDYTFYANSRM